MKAKGAGAHGWIFGQIHIHAREYLKQPKHPPGSLKHFCWVHGLDRREMLKAMADLRDLTREKLGLEEPAGSQFQLALRRRKPLCPHKGPD